MIKTDFQRELSLTITLRNGSLGADVRRVQEWLCLSALRFPAAAVTTAMDEDFGPATERAVQNFEAAVRLPKTGIVTPDLFAKLSAPMTTAFEAQPEGTDIRKAVVQLAQAHLKQRSSELRKSPTNTNLGPWVRAYCNGHDGTPFKWCVGFLQTILDQAASAQGRRFTAIMPRTLSCDELAQSGQVNGRFTDNDTLRSDPSRIRPGDVFLLRNATINDWFHAGLITKVSGDVIETIEGNTDAEGGSNGTAVFARVRNIRRATLDTYSIEGL